MTEENDETDEPQQSRKPIAFFLAVMILVLPVVYVLSSAPLLSWSQTNPPSCAEWWWVTFEPLILTMEVTRLRETFLEWFDMWNVKRPVAQTLMFRDIEASLPKSHYLYSPSP